MRIKLREIAEELGVSPATVSLAVNDRPGISAKTKERILAHIRSKEEEGTGTGRAQGNCRHGQLREERYHPEPERKESPGDGAD